MYDFPELFILGWQKLGCKRKVYKHTIMFMGDIVADCTCLLVCIFLLVRDVGLQVLKEEVQQLKIPDITGDAHVPVVGHITYTVSK